MTSLSNVITGLILAGGKASRMQGIDKGLLVFNGLTLVERSLAVLRPHLTTILISANRTVERYAHLTGCPVYVDDIPDFAGGPLSGIAKGLELATTPYLLHIPCDTPYLPQDLVPRLYTQLVKAEADICVVQDGQRVHPTLAILKVEVLSSLQEYLATGGRKIRTWQEQHSLTFCDYSDFPEGFTNLNTLPKGTP